MMRTRLSSIFRTGVRTATICLLLIMFVYPLDFGLLPPASYAVAQTPQANQTRVLRQGLNGYSGVGDTWISSATWDTPPQVTVNYGQNETLVLSRDGGENPLLRFDLSSIPSHSAIISASLSLYNTTQSSMDGSADFARRVKLFGMMRDWDAGNQVASPINGAGKRGATGENAFDYFSGEGSDVAWNAVGMAAGSDYTTTATSYVDVVNAGWYRWDVTALVQAWVREEQPNYGVVLRDATGYQDNHNDSRVFVSSQATADPTRRPTLTIVYNPDVPFASAGADQERFDWSGGAVLLDASDSRDRPGGNDAALTYTWRIVQAAYGSTLSGNLVTGSANPTRFTRVTPRETKRVIESSSA